MTRRTERWLIGIRSSDKSEQVRSPSSYQYGRNDHATESPGRRWKAFPSNKLSSPFAHTSCPAVTNVVPER